MKEDHAKIRSEMASGAEANNEGISLHSSCDTCNQDEVIDDWSAHLSSGFGHHHQIIVPIQRAVTGSYTGENINQNCVRLHCVESLTPMDMIDLWNGEKDATGNKIWKGALLFIEAFVRIIPNEDVSNRSDNRTSINAYALWLRYWRETLFKDRTVLELGCGTGISSIALLKAKASTQEEVPIPSFLIMSDNENNVLDLCEKNYKINFISEDYIPENINVDVCHLEWSKDPTFGEGRISNKHPTISSFDTVIATDVLYDLESLVPICLTASDTVKLGGYFVLSHIPRASINDKIGSADELEKLIEDEMNHFGFSLRDCFKSDDAASVPTFYENPGKKEITKPVIRPSDLAKVWNTNEMISSTDMDLVDIASSGACILIFNRTEQKTNEIQL